MKEFFKLYFYFIKVVLFLSLIFGWAIFTQMVSAYYLPNYSLMVRFFIFAPMLVLAPALFAYWIKRSIENDIKK